MSREQYLLYPPMIARSFRSLLHASILLSSTEVKNEIWKYLRRWRVCTRKLQQHARDTTVEM